MKTKILFKEFCTHDVMHFVLEKPAGFTFVPGHATTLSFTSGKLKGQKHEFTFTSLPSDLVLEFTIKIYPEHKDFTLALSEAKVGTELDVEEPFGTIEYKHKGTFIAGGAGITPFIAILRDLRSKGKLAGNRLIFSNKTQADVILEKEFRSMFESSPSDLIFTLTREQKPGYESGRIDMDFLKKHIKDFKGRQFYICGPPMFLFQIRKDLKKLGAKIDEIVFER